TIGFTAFWGLPQTTYELVSAAMQNFLNGRNAAEVSMISDGIALLEEHAKAEREGIDSAMEEFVHLKDNWKTTAPASSATGGGQVIARPRLPGTDNNNPLLADSDLPKRIEEKKQQIKETEEERRRQLSEMKAQMAGLLGTYTPSHPAVVALQR